MRYDRTRYVMLQARSNELARVSSAMLIDARLATMPEVRDVFLDRATLYARAAVFYAEAAVGYVRHA